MKIALVGDYDPGVLAHQAIPQALTLAAADLSLEFESCWINSAELEPDSLAGFDGLWCVPLSPYQNPDLVVEGIGFARFNNLPFLGTCAGYQHAVLEFARNALGLKQAGNAEDNPDTEMPLISALSCRLADETDAILIRPGSRVAEIYQCDRVHEEYNCGFGVNRDYLDMFDQTELDFCGFDAVGEPRIFEIREHDFFVGTAFQPERSARGKVAHPLIRAFLKSAG